MLEGVFVMVFQKNRPIELAHRGRKVLGYGLQAGEPEKPTAWLSPRSQKPQNLGIP
jgi:hypothetical protein